MPQITARAYGYRYAARKNATFEDVSFDVDNGEKIIVLGDSGAGKSTLLAAIAGLLGEDEGEHYGELSVSATVGMVLQDPDSQVIASRVGDDVAFGCENLQMPPAEIESRVKQALDMVGLPVDLKHSTEELSGGQKQRLALAGVIAMGADLILLDEPTANLDPAGVHEVVAAVTRVAEETGATVIIIEHRVELWADFVDRALVIAGGAQGGISHLVADGSLGTVIAHQGESLSAAGMWVPGYNLELPPAHPCPQDCEHVLTAHDLIIGWDSPLNPDNPLSVEFPRGYSTVITGANGAGKSTFLLTIAGLLNSHGGEVRAAADLAQKTKKGGLLTNPIDWKSRHLAQVFGYVFQDPEHQFVARTVRQELEVTPRVMGIDADVRIDELLERLNLAHLAEANPFTLSGGQKRRLSVATTLVTAPTVLFLDEPTFGQDRRTFIQLVELVRELTNEGTTVISITHDELYQQALGDKVVAL